MIRKRYLKMILAVSAPLFIFVAIFIFLILYTSGYLGQEFYKNSIASQEAYLKQVNLVFDSEMSSIEKMNNQLIQIDSIKNLQSNLKTEASFQPALEMYEDLKNFHFSSPAIYGFCIIFKDSNLVYSNGNVSTLTNFFYSTYKLEKYTQQELISLLFSKSYSMDYLDVTNVAYLTGENVPCIPIVNSIGYGVKGSGAVILTFVDLNYLQSMIQGYQDIKNGILTIIGKNNEHIFTSNNNSLSVEDTKKLFSLTTKSSVMDWSYLLQQPESAVFKQTLRFQKVALIITIIIILFCFLLEIVFSIVPSNPIKRLLSNNDILEENILRQKENLRKIFLERWITGVFCSKQEMKLYSPYLYQEYKGDLFVVIIIRIGSDLFYNVDDQSKSVSYAYSNEKECIINSLCEELNFNKNNFHDLEVNKIAYVMINSKLSEEEFSNILISQESLIMDVVLSHGWRNTHIGVGSIVDKIELISESLSTALDDFIIEDEGLDMGQGNHRVATLTFTTDLRIKLSQMVVGGNCEGVSNLFKKLISNNVQCIDCSDTMLKAFAYELWGALLNIISKIPDLSDEIKNSIVLDYMNLKKFDDFDKIQRCFNGFQVVTKYCEQSKDLKRNDLAKNIKNYVKENYFDKNICLQSIADEFKLSSAYVSQIFKNTFKQNFIDYLQDIRIKKAQEFLSSTDLKVKDILEKCGYSSSNTFGKAFRRKCGISALEYRRQNNNNFK